MDEIMDVWGKTYQEIAQIFMDAETDIKKEKEEHSFF
ncbi:hypothetical protein MFLO_12561 [Listeria floridensis FSL S10-1187]|uniref:Uncharacterized protein n=1 Tax=Listeria floridensis FSL S10-1187 TaxID=1265817 RepID=A0ABN0RD01_9LIST|nr:hypothetical protein MFLO_12561 [Listeria floridensis FSL S10-1187]